MPKKKNKKKNEATWTAGANPKPVTEPAAGEQQPITREKHGNEYAKELPSEATATELAAIAHQLANVLDEEARIKSDKREANTVFREQLAGLDSLKKKLAECVKTDRKLVPVKCQEFLRSDNLIEVIRLDTSEVIETRQATSDDLQQEMDAAELHNKAEHKRLIEEEEDEDDEPCPECGGENDVHADECSHVKREVETEPAPPPDDGTDLSDLAAETAAAAED